MRKILLLVLSSVLFSCTALDESAKKEEKEPELYVFEEISKADSTKIQVVEKPAIPEKLLNPDTLTTDSKQSFIVQIGAFSNKDRAELFIKENKSKTTYPMLIVYRQDIKLYAVQLPAFLSRTEAENARNSLWQNSSFKGSFIITAQ